MEESMMEERPELDREEIAAEVAARLEENTDLVERLRAGDLYALPSLFKAVGGTEVTSFRVIDPADPGDAPHGSQRISGRG